MFRCFLICFCNNDNRSTTMMTTNAFVRRASAFLAIMFVIISITIDKCESANPAADLIKRHQRRQHSPLVRGNRLFFKNRLNRDGHRSDHDHGEGDDSRWSGDVSDPNNDDDNSFGDDGARGDWDNSEKSWSGVHSNSEESSQKKICGFCNLEWLWANSSVGLIPRVVKFRDPSSRCRAFRAYCPPGMQYNMVNSSGSVVALMQRYPIAVKCGLDNQWYRLFGSAVAGVSGDCPTIVQQIYCSPFATTTVAFDPVMPVEILNVNQSPLFVRPTVANESILLPPETEKDHPAGLIAEEKISAPIASIDVPLVDALAPAKEEALAPVKEEALAPVKEEALAPAKEEALAPAKEEALAPAKEEALAPAKEEALAPAKEEALAPAKEEALAPAKEEALAPAKEEALAPAKVDLVAVPDVEHSGLESALPSVEMAAPALLEKVAEVEPVAAPSVPQEAPAVVEAVAEPAKVEAAPVAEVEKPAIVEEALAPESEAPVKEKIEPPVDAAAPAEQAPPVELAAVEPSPAEPVAAAEVPVAPVAAAEVLVAPAEAQPAVGEELLIPPSMIDDNLPLVPVESNSVQEERKAFDSMPIAAPEQLEVSVEAAKVPESAIADAPIVDEKVNEPIAAEKVEEPEAVEKVEAPIVEAKAEEVAHAEKMVEVPMQDKPIEIVADDHATNVEIKEEHPAVEEVEKIEEQPKEKYVEVLVEGPVVPAPAPVVAEEKDAAVEDKSPFAALMQALAEAKALAESLIKHDPETAVVDPVPPAVPNVDAIEH